MKNIPQKSEYPYIVNINTRWMDNDIYGHVNNVTYYSYFDTAANQYLIEQGGLKFQTANIVGYVVASSCEYHASIAFPDNLEVGVRVEKLGNRSVTYGIAIFKKGLESAVANGSFTHVFVNRETGKAVAIPDKIRIALENISIA